MSMLSNTIRFIKEFSSKYPAVLSGYIIYSYLFISIIRFFLKAKTRSLTLYDIYETFDALPFLWLLASALVQIIKMKTMMHSIEKEALLDRHELEMKQTQLKTLHEVAKGFQHTINNPLTIISLTLSATRRVAMANPEILKRLAAIEDSAGRIKQAVIDFCVAEQYAVEHAGPIVGSVASPRPPIALIDGNVSSSCMNTASCM